MALTDAPVYSPASGRGVAPIRRRFGRRRLRLGAFDAGSAAACFGASGMAFGLRALDQPFALRFEDRDVPGSAGLVWSTGAGHSVAGVFGLAS